MLGTHFLQSYAQQPQIIAVRKNNSRSASCLPASFLAGITANQPSTGQRLCCVTAAGRASRRRRFSWQGSALLMNCTCTHGNTTVVKQHKHAHSKLEGLLVPRTLPPPALSHRTLSCRTRSAQLFPFNYSSMIKVAQTPVWLQRYYCKNTGKKTSLTEHSTFVLVLSVHTATWTSTSLLEKYKLSV